MSDSRPSLWDFNALIRLDRSEPYFFLQQATLFGSDQDRSLRFLLDGLGFNLILDYRVPEWGRFVVVAPHDGTARLHRDAPLLYSDGIAESFSEAGEEFGEQRLIEGLRRHRGLPPECLIAAVVEEVREFDSHDQQDDITLIFAACRETAA